MRKKHKSDWDAFISHASEDKQDFVRPLADALRKLGVNVWYDEYSLKLGDSLTESIDHGLANCSFGIVVLSPSFFSKSWPRRELRGLVARELDGKANILPIWHGVSQKEVSQFSPPLADKVAVKTGEISAREVALQIVSVIKPNLLAENYEDFRAIPADSFAELQTELDNVRDRLGKFLCPICGASIAATQSVPLDPAEKHWGELCDFECGHRMLDGQTQWLCPKDNRFPTISEFNLEAKEVFDLHNDWSETDWAYQCIVKPLTENASMVPLKGQSGATAELSVRNTIHEFERIVSSQVSHHSVWHTKPDNAD